MINWKDVAIGSASTLVVTVVSGIIIYYATKEPAPNPKSEHLVYEIQQLGGFQSQSTKLGIQTIRIANVGDLPASQVNATIEYPNSVTIVDKVASLSSGLAGIFSFSEPISNRLDILIPTITPGESLTVSMEIDQTEKISPDVSVKSQATVGTLGNISPPQLPSKTENLSRVSKWLMPLVLILQIPLAFFFSRRIRRILRFEGGYSPCLNNSAFVLLHQGDTDTAMRLYRRAILQGEADANLFANRALCLAITGDKEGAAKSLAAAELFDKSSGVSKEIILFNRGLIALIEGDKKEAKERIEAALKTSPSLQKAIRSWAQYSTIFQKHSKDLPEIRQLIESPAEK